jgi:hypothetical protein
MFSFNLPEKADLEQIGPISTLKHLSCKKYSFQNLNQFSQGNNMLDAAVSNIPDFLWRDTCVSSTQPIGPVEENRAYLQLEITNLQEVFLSKTN